MAIIRKSSILKVTPLSPVTAIFPPTSGDKSMENTNMTRAKLVSTRVITATIKAAINPTTINGENPEILKLKIRERMVTIIKKISVPASIIPQLLRYLFFIKNKGV